MARELNMANRQCCDVHILDYATMKPWMLVDFCNTTTAGFNADAVYANKKGAKDIKFDNPLEGTMTMVFQVAPFQIYALYSDGEIETSALIARRENVKGGTAGKLTLTNTPKSGTVYAVDPDTGKIIEGTLITPSENERRKIVIANPTDEILKQILGYKEVTESDKPEYNDETQYLKPVYTESDSGISVTWEVCDVEASENTQSDN